MIRQVGGALLALTLLLGLLPSVALAAEETDGWMDSAETAWYEEHSDSGTFEISSAAELAGLAQLVNAGNSFSGKTVVLTGDIDLEDREWTPIGGSGKPFSGTFDGGGQTIRNLCIDRPEGRNVGLFGYTVGGEVKHFTLCNARVTGYLEVGAVSGTPYTSGYTDISVTGLIRVEGFSYVGGALGKNVYADVTNVDVTGDAGSYVRADSIEAPYAYRTYVGGLAGFMGEGGFVVSDCDVSIDVIGSTCDIGGILGILHYGNTLRNCTYEGSLALTTPGEPEDVEFGALTGTIQNEKGATTITDCTATVTKAMLGSQDVTESITPHGAFYHPLGGSKNGGTVSVSAVVNGKPVSTDNCVARVGETGYLTLAQAFEAAGTGGDKTVTILADSSAADWGTIGDFSGITVEGGGYVLTVDRQAFGSAGGNTFRDLTLDLSGASGGCALEAKPGDSFFNVNVKGNSSVLYGILVGGSHADSEPITIDGCTFDGMQQAVYEADGTDAANHLAVRGSTLKNGAGIILYSDDIRFTGNTLDSAKLSIREPGQTVTGNTFLNGSQIVFHADGSAFQNNQIRSESYLEFTEADGQCRDLRGNNFGEQLIVITGVDNASITLPASARSGSVFAGWNDGKETFRAGDIYSVTESVTLTAQWTQSPASSGGGTSSGSKTETITNPDGSVTTTVTNADGSASTTTVDQTGRSETQVSLPPAVVDAAREKGEAVSLPMPPVSAADRHNASTVTVSLPHRDAARVEIPVDNVTPGTVAVIVKADGTEKVIQTSLTTENGVAVTLSDGDTVKIVDNTKRFADVADDHWGTGAVSFAASRELFRGTSETTFTPAGEMTRAMVVTVLARYDGMDTAGGDTWYQQGSRWAQAKGVSDGTDLESPVSREQLATMLWRLAGSPSAEGGLEDYHDGSAVSGWAADAMAWSIRSGLIRGTGEGNLNPQGSATRAEVAAILQRFVAAVH